MLAAYTSSPPTHSTPRLLIWLPPHLPPDGAPGRARGTSSSAQISRLAPTSSSAVQPLAGNLSPLGFCDRKLTSLPIFCLCPSPQGSELSSPPSPSLCFLLYYLPILGPYLAPPHRRSSHQSLVSTRAERSPPAGHFLLQICSSLLFPSLLKVPPFHYPL